MAGTLADDITALMRHVGGSSPALERMTRMSANMQQLEWALARSAAARIAAGIREEQSE